jgi:hypothetical protein
MITHFPTCPNKVDLKFYFRRMLEKYSQFLEGARGDFKAK